MEGEGAVHSQDSKFQLLVDRFALQKPGAQPFKADLLDSQAALVSHGERAAIAFLLNVWDPAHSWKAGKFDVMDALGVWNIPQRRAFLEWACHPFLALRNSTAVLLPYDSIYAIMEECHE